MSQLDDLRQQIDKIDDQLAKLISRRGRLAQGIGEEKARQGKMSHFHVPQRERAILERLKKQNKGPFPNSSIEFIFRELFSATLALGKPLKIAFLGPETTFSHHQLLTVFASQSRPKILPKHRFWPYCVPLRFPRRFLSFPKIRPKVDI